MTWHRPSPISILLALVIVAPAFARAGDATDQIRQTTETLLAIVQDPGLKGPDKDEDRRKQIKTAVDHRFDWAAIARSAMGKYWRGLSEAQRVEFTAVFGKLIENTYLSKEDVYSGEKILYKGDKVDGKYGVVEVVIVTHRGTDIPVSYRVLKKGEEWFVYDLSVEGVSLINNYRSQIGTILNRSSYDDLIARLRVKIAAVTLKQEEMKTGGTSLPKPGGDAL